MVAFGIGLGDMARTFARMVPALPATVHTGPGRRSIYTYHKVLWNPACTRNTKPGWRKPNYVKGSVAKGFVQERRRR